MKLVHEGLCHPGVARLYHYIKQKNLPYTMDDVKQVCQQCRVCAELKPNFYKPQMDTPLIKATKPMERLSVDFKGPLETSTGSKKYIFTAVDEYSRYPFAFAVEDTSAHSVI